MRKTCIFMSIIFFYAGIIVAGGCATQDSPKNAVLRFLNAVRASDFVDIDSTLSFERLISQREGDAYLGLPEDKKAAALEMFKKNMLRELTAGELRHLGEIAPKVEKEDYSGDKAEVTVVDSKNSKRYVFSLSREGGVWKIYSISG
jgi:hypothetical protein